MISAALDQEVQKEVKAGRGLRIAGLVEMGGVSRASFYRFDPDRRPRLDPDRDVRDAIQRIALEFPCYGWRRVSRELPRRGWRVNHKRVRRILRQDNLLCVRKRKFVVTTDSYHPRPVYPNLACAMTLTGIHPLWVADITYLRLETEFVYLAVVLDAFSRRVIGWELDRTGRRIYAGGVAESTGVAAALARAGASFRSRRPVCLGPFYGPAEGAGVLILSRGYAKQALDWTQQVMARIGLTRNEAKTSIRQARQERFDFLGYTFGPYGYRKDGHGYLGAGPSKKSVAQVRQKIGQVLKPSNVQSREEVRDQLHRVLRGWAGYFSQGTRPMAYRAVDHHVYTRVRFFLIRRHKVPSRGAGRYPDAEVLGALGVLRLRSLHLSSVP